MSWRPQIDLEDKVALIELYLRRDIEGIEDFCQKVWDADRKVGGAFWLRHVSSVLKEDGLVEPIKDYPPSLQTGHRQKAFIREVLVSKGYPEVCGLFSVEDCLPYPDAVEEAYKRLAGRTPEKPKGISRPEVTAVTRSEFRRSVAVIAYVLYEADGHCELCGDKAPFTTNSGRPFLEVHHVRHLADGGPDTVENTVALCPNCHRRCHHSEDRERHIDSLYSKLGRLQRPADL